MRVIFIKLVLIFALFISVIFGLVDGLVTVNAMGSKLQITAIQTSGKNGAGDESIEITNFMATDIKLYDIRLEYFAANPKDLAKPSRTIKLNGTLLSNQTFLVTSTEYSGTKGNIQFSSTLANEGGHLKLAGSQEYDFVGWGTARFAKVKPALAPEPGERLIRKSTTGDNSLDFEIFPKRSILQDSASKVNDQRIKPGQIIINEIFPDPKAPQKDQDYEFVEIKNNTYKDINLRDIKISVGNKNLRQKVLSGQIKARSYKIFKYKDLKISLTNSGGKVILKNLDDQIIDKVSYPKFKSGNSWAWISGDWKISGKPTPGKTNIWLNPSSLTIKVGRKSGRRKLKSSGRVLSNQTSNPVQANNQTPPIHPTVVAGVGGLAVIYGLYEYRQDMARLYQKLRRNRKDR